MNQKSATICDHVLNLKDRSRDSIAVKYKREGQWRQLSWPEYYDRILTVGCALLAYGIKPGTRVAIMANTRVEWSIADYAIMGVQAITVPIYQTVTAEDLKFILNNSEAEMIFIENKSLLKMLKIVLADCPSLKRIVSIEAAGETGKNISNWNDLYAYGTQEKLNFQSQFVQLGRATQLKDAATIIYTSGTTGQPKGVVLCHEQIISEVTEAFPFMGAQQTDTSLSFLPYAHILGRIEHWGHVYTGFTLAFAESIERVKNNLVDIKPDFMIAVPRIFEKIYSGIYAQMEGNLIKGKLFEWAVAVGLKAGELRLKREPLPIKLALEYALAQKLVLNNIKLAFGGKLRFCVSGGAPLARDIALFFHACDILILEGYGLTETTAAICVNTPYSYRFGSVGRPIGDVELKIAEDGEILVRSKKVMREYYKNPTATEQAFTQDWFHTGDIGEVTPSGDLKITDRKKDLIKTAGGKYVAPQRLENLLKANTFVSNVLIHGDQKKYIVALITLNQTFLKSFARDKGLNEENPDALTQHPQILEVVRRGVAETNTHLASFESIKRFAVLPRDFTVESGELTPSLKVKRKVLDLKYRDQIASLYS
jgi:long-chain acyl-CoA synthetase